LYIFSVCEWLRENVLRKNDPLNPNIMLAIWGEYVRLAPD
jgi:hypothetical protein